MVRDHPGEVAQGLEKDGARGAVEAGEEWEARDPAPARAENVSARNAGQRSPISPPFPVFR